MWRNEFYLLVYCIGIMVVTLSYGFTQSAVDYYHFTNLTTQQVHITSIQVDIMAVEENTLCVCTPQGIFKKNRPCDVHVFSGEMCSARKCGSIFAGNTYSLLTNEDDDDCYDTPFVNQKLADSRLGLLIFGMMDAPIIVLFVLVFRNPPNYLV